MTSQIYPLSQRERVIQFKYLPPGNEFNLSKINFYLQNRSYRPKIDFPCQFQQFPSRQKLFRKEQWTPPPEPVD